MVPGNAVVDERPIAAILYAFANIKRTPTGQQAYLEPGYASAHNNMSSFFET